MKKNLSIFVLAIAVLGTQACGSKTEKNMEETSTIEAAEVKKEVALTAEQRKAKLEKEKTERAEKRRIEREELAKINLTYTDSEGNVVYNKAEIDPSYNGGDKEMMKYLQNNLKFPKQAEEDGLEGTVFVDFVVTKSGTVRQVEIAEATTENVSFRDEAVRLITSMPKWIPGRQHGKAVDVKFSIPITFQMI